MAKVAHVAKMLDTDRQLAEHLKKAEDHLIEAVKLFEKKKAPKRPVAFMDKLGLVQEMATSLYREELVRIRGPIKMTMSAGSRKK